MTATRKEQPVEGQQPRLRDVFEQHGAFVCRSLRLLGVAEADLDDMLQEVFVVVYQRLADYQERGRARSWLYSICTRVALAQRRKVGRRRENLAAEPPDRELDATQDHGIEQRQALVVGRRLLAQLPAEQREVFMLYEVEDMSMPEIAEALSCPLQTAYSRLRAARQRVLSELARESARGERP